MQIVEKKEAIHVSKPDGTKVDYYIFSEHEIHFNKIPAGTGQQWHSHREVDENLFITKGEIEVNWLDDEKEHQVKTVKEGDVVRVQNSIHTLINRSDNPAQFVVFRFIPEGIDKRERIKRDKTIHSL